MHRRWIGLALMLLAIAAIVAVPRALGREIAGTPAVGPIPAPPAPGMCLPPFEDQVELDALPTPAPVPCDRPHGAEVTLVAQLDTAADTRSAWPTSGADPVLAGPIETCQAHNASFVGTSGVATGHRVPPRYRSKVTVPSHIQWLAGQRWYACAVLPDAPPPISYAGTAAGSMSAPPPAPFATCATAPRMALVPCDRPHAAEQLTIGTSDITPAWPPARPADATSCWMLASTIIGTPDPGFGGLIEIIGWSDASGLSCWLQVAGGHTVVGTLIGHGSGAPPIG